MTIKEELPKGLTEEQNAKFKECNSAEERLASAKKTGVELNDELLESVSGACSNPKCPNCGSDVTFFVRGFVGDKHYQCRRSSWGFKG